jgi:hypothetical protein
LQTRHSLRGRITLPARQAWRGPIGHPTWGLARTKKDAIAKDAMSKDAMKKDAMPKDGMSKDPYLCAAPLRKILKSNGTPYERINLGQWDAIRDDAT